MDRGAWWARVHRVTKNQTQLTRLSTHSGQYKQIMEYSQSVSFLFRKCTRGGEGPYVLLNLTNMVLETSCLSVDRLDI